MKNIIFTREDIIAAAKIWDEKPNFRGFKRGTRYEVRINGKPYPPKAIASIANELAGGEVLWPQDFAGAWEGKWHTALADAGFKPEPIREDTILDLLEKYPTYREGPPSYGSKTGKGSAAFIWRAVGYLLEEGKINLQTSTRKVSDAVVEFRDTVPTAPVISRNLQEVGNALSAWREWHKQESQRNQGEAWSDAELHGAVRAYIEMQQKTHLGEHFKKSAYYQRLAEKYGRSPKSFEWRMQNISYVMTLLGRTWLSGLKPARNISASDAEKIEKIIAQVEGRQLLPSVAFEIKSREVSERKNLSKPQGSQHPTLSITTISQHQRDSAVKGYVLQQAQGKCECCNKPAPFKNSNGQPYLEVHHVRHLADQGSDTVENTVALCPNCHRALHFSAIANELIESLYDRIPRLKRE